MCVLHSVGRDAMVEDPRRKARCKESLEEGGVGFARWTKCCIASLADPNPPSSPSLSLHIEFFV